MNASILSFRLPHRLAISQVIAWSILSSGAVRGEEVADAKAHWDRIVAAGRQVEPFDVEDGKYWAMRSERMRPHFYAMLRDEETREKNLEFFLSQLGEDSLEANVCWVLSAPHLLLPEYGMKRPWEKPWPKGKEEEIQRAWDIEADIYRTIVKKCMSDPEFRERYYRLVLWSSQWLGHPQSRLKGTFGVSVAVTKDGFDQFRDNPHLYWVNARKTILLCHATSQDDRLADRKISDIHDVFYKWQKWYDAQGGGNFDEVRGEFRWKPVEKKVWNLHAAHPTLSKLPPFPGTDDNGDFKLTPKILLGVKNMASDMEIEELDRAFDD